MLVQARDEIQHFIGYGVISQFIAFAKVH